METIGKPQSAGCSVFCAEGCCWIWLDTLIVATRWNTRAYRVEGSQWILTLGIVRVSGFKTDFLAPKHQTCYQGPQK